MSWSIEQVIEAVQRNDRTGICEDCGSEQQNIDPDATGIECEDCGKNKVSGAEEFMFKI